SPSPTGAERMDEIDQDHLLKASREFGERDIQQHARTQKDRFSPLRTAGHCCTKDGLRALQVRHPRLAATGVAGLDGDDLVEVTQLPSDAGTGGEEVLERFAQHEEFRFNNASLGFDSVAAPMAALCYHTGAGWIARLSTNSGT